ncbi:hypothetical protein OSTOST_24660, partial [Ostertagia ostertagi]
MTIYGELMDNLKKIIALDSNINVVIVALQVVAKLANGLRDRFGCFVSMLWAPILDKSKDKKVTVRTAVGQALDAISDVCATDRLTKDLCEHLSKPNPQSKQCLCGFLTRYFVRQNTPQLEFAKTVLPVVVKVEEYCVEATKQHEEFLASRPQKERSSGYASGDTVEST